MSGQRVQQSAPDQLRNPRFRALPPPLVPPIRLPLPAVLRGRGGVVVGEGGVTWAEVAAGRQMPSAPPPSAEVEMGMMGEGVDGGVEGLGGGGG